MAKQLAEFIQQQRKKWIEQQTGMHYFESFEQELHKLVMALECELLCEELGYYDVSAEKIMVEKKTNRRGRCSTETYLTAEGCVSVARHLYHSVDPLDKSICPLELRSGVIAGYFTPRAARPGAYEMAHPTSGESEAMFDEIGQSNRWPFAWALLSADFHATIILSKPHSSKDISANQTPLRILPCPTPIQLFDRSSLPLAV